jgi:hypothetical protein
MEGPDGWVQMWGDISKSLFLLGKMMIEMIKMWDVAFNFAILEKHDQLISTMAIPPRATSPGITSGTLTAKAKNS